MSDFESIVLESLSAIMRGETGARPADRLRAAEMLLKYYGLPGDDEQEQGLSVADYLAGLESGGNADL